jgi:hypothetical protein
VNGKAWMMTEIFCFFFHSLDAQMGVQNRQIILFVDNCAAHSKDTSFLRNFKVVTYPANCRSMLQPLDLGIIHSLKAYYRKHLLQTSICLMELGKEVKKKINILEAMHYIMAAWQQVSQQTIRNCFREAGHKYQSDGNEMANDDDDDDFGQDWEEQCVEPRNTISKAMSQWIAMWQQVALKVLKNYAKHLGIQGVWRKRLKKMKMNKRWCRDLRSFTKS